MDRGGFVPNYMMTTPAAMAGLPGVRGVTVLDKSSVKPITKAVDDGLSKPAKEMSDASGKMMMAAMFINMGISGITYSEFLYQSMNKPFVVGLTYYQSATTNQVLETLTLISRDVNGNESQKTLVPTIDPYQQQSTVIAIKYSYKIDRIEYQKVDYRIK